MVFIYKNTYYAFNLKIETHIKKVSLENRPTFQYNMNLFFNAEECLQAHPPNLEPHRSNIDRYMEQDRRR